MDRMRAVAVHFKGTPRASFYPNATEVEVLAMDLDGEKALVRPIDPRDGGRPRWVTTERLSKPQIEG